MTDRLKGCTVVFDRDIREDDAESLLNAICMIKGVVTVVPSPTKPDDQLVRERALREFREEVILFVASIKII